MDRGEGESAKGRIVASRVRCTLRVREIVIQGSSMLELWRGIYRLGDGRCAYENGRAALVEMATRLVGEPRR